NDLHTPASRYLTATDKQIGQAICQWKTREIFYPTPLTRGIYFEEDEFARWRDNHIDTTEDQTQPGHQLAYTHCDMIWDTALRARHRYIEMRSHPPVVAGLGMSLTI